MGIFTAQMALFTVNTGCRNHEVCSLRLEWELVLDDGRLAARTMAPKHAQLFIGRSCLK
jgi:hypothetical protein